MCAADELGSAVSACRSAVVCRSQVAPVEKQDSPKPGRKKRRSFWGISGAVPRRPRISSLLRAASVKAIMASPLSGVCSRTLSASFACVVEVVPWPHNNGRAVFDFERFWDPARSPFSEMQRREAVPVVLPHRADSFECERVLRVQLQHVEVAHLGFVVVAGFEIIVGLGKKACLSWLPWSSR